MAMDKKSVTVHYRDVDDKKHEIKIQKQGDQFIFEEFCTNNFYELLMRTSLFEKIFKTFPHQFVAITREAQELPIEEQPWFFGCITDAEVRHLLKGNSFVEQLTCNLQKNPQRVVILLIEIGLFNLLSLLFATIHNLRLKRNFQF